MNITGSNPPVRPGTNDGPETDTKLPESPTMEAEEEMSQPARYTSPPYYLAEFADFDADSVTED